MMTTLPFVKRTLSVALLTAFCSAAHADFLQEGKIIAGSDITFPPYEYMVNGEPVGFDIEILDGIARTLGKTAVSVDTRFPNLIPGLQGKRFDITNSAMYITPERLKVIDMIPYLKTGQQIVTLTGSTYKPEAPEEFCGHKIGTMAGTSFVQNLQKLSAEYCVAKGLKPIQLSEYPTDPQTTQALLSHAVEAQITDVAVAQAAVSKLGGRVEITSKTLLYPVLVGIGVRKDDPAIKAAITEGLKKFSQTAEYQALFARYHFTPAPLAE
ncbi:MAG: putative ABC transporter arginine-binding protein ArtJ [Candidatus Erwinia impunctatus]|nr:putative ABC transporter arginine-binding protein ArtJ [Culicoides impunctatus]